MGDTVTDIPFPLSGQNVAGEFGAPPGMTAVKGVNCRGYDPIARRLRGGSRPGLTKFLPVATPAGTHLIQHLDVIVDPTVDALPADFDNTGPTPTYPDPTEAARNPFGRLVRYGGSGVGLLRHKPATPGRFVQKQSTFVSDSAQGTSSTSGGVAFDSPVTAGNLIVVTVRYATQGSNTPTFHPPTDTAGTAYAKAAEAVSGLPGPDAAVIFYGIVPLTGSGPNTVSLTVSTDGNDVGAYTIDVLEYRRVAQSGALAGAATNGGSFTWTGDFTLSPGPVQTTRDDSIVVAVVSGVLPAAPPAVNTIGPAPAFTTDPQPTGRAFPSTNKGVFDLIPVEASGLGITPTFSVSGGSPNNTTIFWAMAAASFSPP